MAYIIKDTTRKGPANYVNYPGRHNSYTTKPYARRFDTYEQAEREKCGNETILKV
jgi:hypothetical protein